MQQGDAPQRNWWSYLTETRVGSTSLLGCIVQPLLVGLVMVVIAWLLLTQL